MEVSVVQAILREIHFELEAGVELELIVHYLRGTHLQLALLRLGAIDNHEDIVKMDGAFICHSHFANHRVALVAGHGELASYVKLKTLENH